MNTRFDVLVVGAGPAGIAAAVSAAEVVRRVALVDDNPSPGGQIWRKGAALPASARRWLGALNASSVSCLSGWSVYDAPAPGVLSAERNSEHINLHYDKLILATGARELFLPFPGWTLPNVFGAGGLGAMARGGLPVQGKRIVIAGSGPLLLAVAAHLAARGARIVAVCEQAPIPRLARFAVHLLPQPAKLMQGVAYRWAFREAAFHTRCWPVAANGTEKLESVTLQQVTRQWSISCDYLACGFHLVPNIELAQLIGCRIEDGLVATDDLQTTSLADVLCAGEPTGIGGVELALVEGQVAGLAAAGNLEVAQKLARRRRKMLGFARSLSQAYALDPQLRKLASDATFVCRCEDVAFGALRPHNSWRDAKLHTRCGMGPCQGRVCGAAASFLFNWNIDGIRPPVIPALVSSLAATNTISDDTKENT